MNVRRQVTLVIAALSGIAFAKEATVLGVLLYIAAYIARLREEA